jgi:hypothetical protein
VGDAEKEEEEGKERKAHDNELREDLRNGLVVACMLTRFRSFEALRLRREREMLGAQFRRERESVTPGNAGNAGLGGRICLFAYLRLELANVSV